MVQDVQNLINRHNYISILSHRNPDADTLGTALGVYALLKAQGKSVEIVNADQDLPKSLDFLPNYQKIKQQIDYDDSLIIGCDSGSIELFGFDLTGRKILNIDHHYSNTYYGTLNVVNPNHAAASCVAYELFKSIYELNKDAVLCFYTALVSDTQYFTTSSVSKETFDIASDMITFEIDISEVAYNLRQRRTLASMRVLSTALESLQLSLDGELAIMAITQADIKASGAKASDMIGIVDHALSLATVKVALLIMEWEDHIRLSMRSKDVDISRLARSYGGGGHQHAAGFQTKRQNIDTLIEELKQKIKNLGILDGT
jgi:phosphoesterase RecJ-like protein